MTDETQGGLPDLLARATGPDKTGPMEVIDPSFDGGSLTLPRPRYPDGFATVRTEGAILPRDLLARIAAGQEDLKLLRPKHLTTPGVRGYH